MLDVVLVFVMTCLIVRWWLFEGQKNLPPSPGLALPVVGHVYLLTGDTMEVIEKWRQRFANLYMLKFGSTPVVLIHEYSILHEALIKNHDVFVDRSENFVTKTILNNKGILSLGGDAWREQRAFLHSTLRDLGMGKNIMAERIQEEVKHFLKVIEETRGEPVDLSHLISTTTCNIICGVVFGKRFSHTDEKLLELLSILQFMFRELKTTALIQFIPFLKYLPGDYFLYHESLKQFKRLQNIVSELVNKGERKINVNDEAFEDLVQAYLTEIEKKKIAGVRITSIDEDNMLVSIKSLLGAATETTSKTIIFGLLYLVYFQDVQEKIFTEIKKNVGLDVTPSITDKPKLKYLNAFIYETLRYSKLGPFFPDRIANQDVMLGGYFIPKGTVIVPVYETLMWNKDVWGDPENFRPDRFLNKVRKEFVPFSIGKRNCVGEAMAVAELFLFFSVMIQRFQFFPENVDQKPSLKTTFGISRTPVPFKVRAVLRSSTE